MSSDDTLARPKWSERRFRFVHPSWMLRDLVERLSGTPARLEERVRDCPANTALQRVDGTWSIQQNAGHLADVEELWQLRIAELARGVATYSPADADHFRARAERHQEGTMEEVLREFRAKRAELATVLLAAGPELQDQSAHHERLGCPMRLVDIAQFVAEHDDHHLLRIAELGRRGP